MLSSKRRLCNLADKTVIVKQVRETETERKSGLPELRPPQLSFLASEHLLSKGHPSPLLQDYWGQRNQHTYRTMLKRRETKTKTQKRTENTFSRMQGRMKISNSDLLQSSVLICFSWDVGTENADWDSKCWLWRHGLVAAFKFTLTFYTASIRSCWSKWFENFWLCCPFEAKAEHVELIPFLPRVKWEAWCHCHSFRVSLAQS